MRSWTVIPAMGAIAAGAALGLSAARGVALEPGVMIASAAAGAAGAAITAAIRALVGDSAASLAGAVLAPLLAIAIAFDPMLTAAMARGWIAIAAGGWTIVELSRPTTSPVVAMLPATVAAVLDPSFVVLVPIAGSRLMTSPWRRPRWAIAVPIAGVLLVLGAVIVGPARGGVLASVGDTWTGVAAAPIGAPAFAVALADVFGPIMAVAALAGLWGLARVRHAELAWIGCGLGALLFALRAGTVTPAVIAFGAVTTGLAIGRFAGTIRIASAQALAGAAVGVMLLVPPTWTAIEHGTTVRTEASPPGSR